MTAFWIILGLAATVFIMFSTDKKAEVRNNLAKGGLKEKFPRFVIFCEHYDFQINELEFKLVKDDGKRIEYRCALHENEQLIGYLHVGVHGVMGVRLYNYFITCRGNKIHGYARELKSPPGMPFIEPYIDMYEKYFNFLLQELMNTKEFQLYIKNK